MAGFSQCDCEHCGRRLEFSVEADGATAVCPHCQGQTTLCSGRSGPGQVAMIPAKGGRRYAGFAALAVGVLVAGSIGGWVALKKFSPGKPTSGVETGKRSIRPKDSSPAVAGTSAAAPQPLTAAVAPAGEIKKGREVYMGKCAKCHQFYDPAAYNDFDWNHWMGRMRGEAKLNGDQAELLNRFLASLRNP